MIGMMKQENKKKNDESDNLCRFSVISQLEISFTRSGIGSINFSF